MLSDKVIRTSLADYGVQASPLQCEQVRIYIALLLKWNRSISLTSVSDETKILRFHFGESVFALSAVSGMVGRLADVGAGAGFPGLPLRIFDDSLDLNLIEANSRKCAFLNEIVHQLGLTSTCVLRTRYEDLGKTTHGGFDLIAARAIGGYDELLQWAAHTLTSAGRIILWLGEEDARKVGRSGGWQWQPTMQIPGSTRRYLLAGSPLARGSA
jgi:16S rRNA (guanine527-N7)-methyltransferase